jgi:hypothetical protein
LARFLRQKILPSTKWQCDRKAFNSRHVHNAPSASRFFSRRNARLSAPARELSRSNLRRCRNASYPGQNSETTAFPFYISFSLHRDVDPAFRLTCAPIRRSICSQPSLCTDMRHHNIRLHPGSCGLLAFLYSRETMATYSRN